MIFMGLFQTVCSFKYMGKGTLQNKYDVENDNKDENEDEDKVYDEEIFEHESSWSPIITI